MSHNPSLLSFFNEVVAFRLKNENLHILDLGCGSQSIFEEVDLKNNRVFAIDISENALKKTCSSSHIQYAQANILDAQKFSKEKFDLIFDSHCFNCLMFENDRNQAYKNVFNSLQSGGIFASEMMVHPAHQKVLIPNKMVLTAFEIEQEILKHGFKIIYFLISKNFVFYNVMDGIETNCDVVRIVALK